MTTTTERAAAQPSLPPILAGVADTLLNDCPDFIFAVSVPDYRLLWGNGTVVKHFANVRGIPDIVGKPIGDIAFNSPNAALWSTLFERARSQGAFETWYRSPIDANRWWLRAFPVSQQDHCVAIVIWARNHEELVATRDRLTVTEGMYKSLFDSMACGVVYHGNDGRIIAVNHAAETMLGRTAAQLMGLASDNSEWGAVHDDGQPFAGPAHPAMVTLRTGQPQTDVMMGILRPDGERRWLSIHTQPVHFADAQQDTAVVATFHDITDRRVIRESLKEKIGQLDKAWDETLAAMADIVDKRDPYTAGHQHHVADIAEAIARQMGWDAARCTRVRQAALVHDIGQIAIPTDILVKPTRLSKVEFSIVKLHVEHGYGILNNIAAAQPIAAIMRQHHERLDGSGYPLGLQGDAILPEARVLAVADVAEAMTSHRPFRPALGIDATLQELDRGTGSLYDADVVAAFKQALAGGLVLPAGS